MRFLISLALLSLAAAAPALAQEEPPARVGSLSYVSGNVAFHAAGETQWSAAGINYPVATGESFWADAQARAEIQIGPTTLDLASGTELDVTNLNEQMAQFGVPQGRIYLHLRQLDEGQGFEIDTPQGAVWLLQPGYYDIDAGTADQPARVAVFDGSARFVGGGADIGIKAGDAAVLSGSNPVAARIERAQPDAFVEWCRARDYNAKKLAAPYYVSPHMTGYADLEGHGAWQSNPQYGEVWYPSQVPADWAPYRDGRWISVPPWGWTWVDQQPWGFAPFHYGRWAHMGDRWGWVPGSYVARPVYAPALVAFVGAAAGGLALAGGGGPAVGWFPLGPGETYWPSYTRNTNYIRNVNITNVKNINTIVTQSNGVPPAQAASANFANRRFATVVPQRVFANADPVAPAAIKVPPAALAKAPVVLHPPQVRPAAAPAAAAIRGPEHPRAVAAPTPGPPIRPVPTTAAEHGAAPGRPAAAAPGTGTAAEHGAAPGHPAAATTPEAGPHPPTTAAEHGAAPGHPAATTPEAGPHPPGTAAEHGAAPGRPGAATAPEAGPHPPGTGTAAEHGAAPAHPGRAPNTAALPPPHPGAVPREPAAAPRAEPTAPSGVANLRREAAPKPPAAREQHPAPPSEPRPSLSRPPEQPQARRPQPAPAQAQTVRPPAMAPRAAPAVARPAAPAAVRPAPVPHPPAPAVVRAAPIAHPPAPAMVRAAPPARPPAPAVQRTIPAVQRPAPAPPPARPAPQAARSGGKPAAAHGAKEGEKHD